MHLSLLKAIDRFHPDHGAQFSTFAVFSMLRDLSDELERFRRNARRQVSSDWDFSRTQAPEPEPEPVLLRGVDRLHRDYRLSVVVQEILGLLSPTDRFIVEAHFGLGGRGPMTLEGIGQDPELIRLNDGKGMGKAAVQGRLEKTLRALRGSVRIVEEGGLEPQSL
ncbi:MAG: hypothetical protein EA369_06185 [Bradymonadales bacterium]|nr:MAG: hypothetical protein EA369_06185 [Bradymonadales bacterium]